MRGKKYRLLSAGVLVFLFIGLSVPFSAAAQSNEVIDSVLAQGELIYKNGAYFVLTASGMIPETAEPEEAYDFLLRKQEEWKLKEIAPDKRMRVGDFSYLMMRSLDIKGGLLYRIFPGPRYAARELSYLGFIKEHPSPCRELTGSEALQILGDALEWKGGQQ